MMFTYSCPAFTSYLKLQSISRCSSCSGTGALSLVAASGLMSGPVFASRNTIKRCPTTSYHKGSFHQTAALSVQQLANGILLILVSAVAAAIAFVTATAVCGQVPQAALS